MDPLTPKRQSPSDDFTAVKRLPDDDRTTQITAALEDPTNLSIPPAPPPGGELPPGTKVGDYVIEEKVGQGGMGEVYRAVHPMIGKMAAVKVLNGDLNADQYNLERFLDEAKVVNTIGHPNIVDVFAFGETEDGRRYLIMEWLRGETLRDRLERAPISLAEVSDIVRPLIRALMAAHDKGVIHRDLKPDNIFLVENRGEAPIVKLLDFGIAKPASTEHRVAKTATGAIVGTPLYIAPEQAKGREIDSAADIYALGGILFEMLCQRPPFLADNAMEIVAKHLMEPAPRPSQFASGIPKQVDDLVIAMLAKEPLQRPLLPAVLKVVEAMRDQRRAPTPLPVRPLEEERAPRMETPVPLQPSLIQSITPVEGSPRPPIAAAITLPPREPAPIDDRVTTQLRGAGPPWRIIIPIAAVIGVVIIAVIALGGGGGDVTANDPPVAPAKPVVEEIPPTTSAPTSTPIEPPDIQRPDDKPSDAVAKPVATPIKKPEPAAKPARPQPLVRKPVVVKKPEPKKPEPKKPEPKKLPKPDENGLFEPGSFTNKK